MIKYVLTILWLSSIFILSNQSQIAYEQLPDLIHHKSEMMAKDKLLGVVYGAAIIFNVIFAGVALFLPLFSTKLLPNLINIPNKKYWHEIPVRIQKASTKMSCGLLWFCLVINGVFWYIIDLTLRSERMGASQPVSGSVIFLILAGFFAGFLYQYFAFRMPRRKE